MKLTEKRGDLFSAPSVYYLVHCIPADYEFKTGINLKFKEKMDMNNKLIKSYKIPMSQRIGKALLVGRVFNLVTTVRYWEKPTVENLAKSLISLRSICEDKWITRLAMPRIACGEDGMSWPGVKSLIENIFEDTDIEIVVYTN